MANSKKILICNQWDNPHAAVIVDKLQKLNLETYWINPTYYPNDMQMSYSLQNDEVILKVTDKPAISCRDISVVLVQSWRYLKHLDPDNWEIDRYNDYESDSFLKAFAAVTPHCYWLNNLLDEEQATLKPYQLMLAKQLGFLIPETYIGNNPEHAETFVKQHNVIALKALNQGGMATQTPEQAAEEKHTSVRFLTQKFNSADFLPYLSYFSNCPTILQAYIPKQLELRITVIGEQLFACAIDSQKSEKSASDWRNYDFENTPYFKFDLPKEVEAKCFALLNKLNLDVGAIDMILTPDNEFVFLEINPRFAWLWIEQLTGLPIADTLAGFVLEKHQKYS